MSRPVRRDDELVLFGSAGEVGGAGPGRELEVVAEATFHTAAAGLTALSGEPTAQVTTTAWTANGRKPFEPHHMPLLPSLPTVNAY